jgi:hypothetical protein
VLDYFGFRQWVISGIVAGGLAVWAWMSQASWPVITAVGMFAFVSAVYLLLLPAFLGILKTGVRERPDPKTWKHAKQFRVIQVACLLADYHPHDNPAMVAPEANAWIHQLIEALSSNEIERIQTREDDAKHVYVDGQFASRYYVPHAHTLIARDELIKFCEACDLHPEFL